MAKKPTRTWKFKLVEDPYQVDLFYRSFGRKGKIYVNGEEVPSERKTSFLGNGVEFHFSIGSRACFAIIKSGLIAGATYDLVVNGISLESRQPKLSVTEVKMPVWAWPFIVACFLIPIVTRGGAIPAAIGFGSAFACAALARDGDQPVPMRIAMCFGVTSVAWILFVALVLALS